MLLGHVARLLSLLHDAWSGTRAYFSSTHPRETSYTEEV